MTFLLAANPGSPLLPLTRVASGGELARTMLAPPAHAQPGRAAPGLTLVFDEVDAGIGGTAATAVGAALARLGEDAQVLVVTHLAQVAALASTQYVVDKTVRNGHHERSPRRRSRATNGSPRSPGCCPAATPSRPVQHAQELLVVIDPRDPPTSRPMRGVG